MSRWAPNARERLEDAALDLFLEQGYEATTVAQIAERADLNRATFFRHFIDKREILFGGEERLADLFAAGVRDAPVDATVTDRLRAALESGGTLMTAEQRSKTVRRRAVAAANVEVQERGLLKLRAVADALATALRESGTDALTARLGAEVAMLAFGVALERWARTDDPFAPFVIAALEELRLRVAALGPAAPDRAQRAITPGASAPPATA